MHAGADRNRPSGGPPLLAAGMVRPFVLPLISFVVIAIYGVRTHKIHRPPPQDLTAHPSGEQGTSVA